MPRGRIVLTGVAGFIGSNLADRLLGEGYEVVGIDDLSQGVLEQVPPAVEFHRADIRSDKIQSLFERADAVFHLAARNCISDCQQDPLSTMSVNVMGTTQVFEAARRAAVRKVIYAESSALYEGVDVFPTPEDQVAPVSFYAVSKLAAREVAQAYARFGGPRTTALRYFCVYGPRQDYRRTIPPVMSAFILRMLNGERARIYGDGTKRRDFVHVDDVNDFHLLCLAGERTDGGTFNLGSGQDHSVREIHDLIASLLGSEAGPEHWPELPGEAARTCANIARAKALGWEPRVGLVAGLADMITHLVGLREGRARPGLSAPVQAGSAGAPEPVQPAP